MEGQSAKKYSYFIQEKNSPKSINCGPIATLMPCRSSLGIIEIWNIFPMGNPGISNYGFILT